MNIIFVFLSRLGSIWETLAQSSFFLYFVAYGRNSFYIVIVFFIVWNGISLDICCWFKFVLTLVMTISLTAGIYHFMLVKLILTISIHVFLRITNCLFIKNACVYPGVIAALKSRALVIVLHNRLKCSLPSIV